MSSMERHFSVAQVAVRICRCGARWAVRQFAWVLNRAGEWEDEPLPSNRDDAFYAHCRFDTYEEAEKAAKKALEVSE